MSLQDQVMQEMKTAMKAKDPITLESLRAIKSALLLARTEKGGGKDLSEADEVSLVQKLVKQRKDSAAIYKDQGREDLAGPELAQVAGLERFLPEQLSEAEIREIVEKVIADLEASSMKDMGRVMGTVNKKLAGKADGKTIAMIVKSQLS